MPTLQEKLNNLRANFEKNAPKNALTIMHRATRDLKNSGTIHYRPVGDHQIRGS
jgi:hypothetical protein